MADSNSQLKNVEVKVAPRSGFNKSHKSIGSLSCGTITPILVDTLIPNTDASVKIDLTAQLPPLVSDTYMRASIKVEAFAVPMRLLYGGFEDWFTQNKVYNEHGAGSIPVLPRLHIKFSNLVNAMGPCTLSDYLGVHLNQDAGSGKELRNKLFNIFPYLAYHKIYDDWYRNALVQQPVFSHCIVSDPSLLADNMYKLSNLPWITSTGLYEFGTADDLKFNDDVSLLDLRQRNYGCDYFTSATPGAQYGVNSAVSMNVVSGGTSFTIASLRAANSLQQFRERNNIAGPRLQDYCRGIYGADLSDGVAQRSVYLGSASYDIYSNGVYQTNMDSGNIGENAYNSVGAKYGSAYAPGSNFFVRCKANEPMILMVMATLVPETNYSSGVDVSMRYFTSSDPRGDLANPLLQNVGQQPIYTDELVPLDVTANAGKKFVFGYVDRYADFKVKNNQVHGQMVYCTVNQKGLLKRFVQQRSLDTFESTNPEISTAFLQIPKDAMNDVMVDQLNEIGCWYDAFIDYNVVMPLAKYSMPSLQDPAYEHGDSMIVKRGGSRID